MKNAGCGGMHLNSLSGRKHNNNKFLIQASLNNITRAKRAGSMAQAVEHLSSNGKARIETPVLPPPKKEERQKKNTDFG
jgi:hypothetical protein